MNTADIIIVNYNSTKYLIKCLDSIKSNGDKFLSNIFVFDNDSSDNYLHAKRMFPQFTFIGNSKNIGFSAAVNKGLKISKSPYVVLLNPDTFINNGLIEKCLCFMEKNERVGVLGPKILDSDGSIQGSARSFPTPLTTLFGRRSPITKLYPNNSITRSNILTCCCDGKTPLKVDWVSGACMIVRKNAIEAVNGFDERFFLYWEDTDLCKRIKDKGWQVVYYPKAQITHCVGKSSSHFPIFSTYHFHRSCYYLFLKHARMPMKLIAPLAFLGLSLRAIVVMIIHLVQGQLRKAESANRTVGKKPVIADKQNSQF